MKIAVSILSFITFISISALGQTPGSIRGTVGVAGEGSVLHQASVQIVELKRSAVTGGDGTYEFKDVPPGTYTLVAHQEGFSDSRRRVRVDGGQVTADFALDIAGVKEDVTVTASGSEVSTFESIASVATVDSSELVQRAAVGLGDVLEAEPGVSKRSSSPGASRPVIRGFDGDRVMIASDGVGAGSLGSQSGDHSEPIDTLAVERIEIVKGPATLLYGSNAIGGVVNAISGHDEGAHPGFRGYVSGIGGTNNSQLAGSTGLEYGRDNFTVWGSGSGQRTGDYAAGGGFGKVRNTFTRNAAGTAGAGYFGKNAFITANYGHYRNEYGIPLDTREAEPEPLSIKMHRNDLKLNFGLADLKTIVTSAKFTVGVSRYRHREIEDGVVGTVFRNDMNSYRGMFEQKTAGRLSGRFGFDGYSRDYSTIGEESLIAGPVRQKALSIFGLEELKFARVTLQFGGRVENNRYDPINSALPNRSFTGFSGAAGVRFALWEGGAFIANYSHAYRAPALEELYNNGPHGGTLLFEIGDPALRPEVSDGIDLSLRHRRGRIKAEANFFHYAFRNFVFLAPNGEIDPDSGFEKADYLQANSRYTGTELSLDAELHKYLNFQTSLDYVNARLRDGRPLPRIPPLRSRVSLDLHYKGLTVRPEFVAAARQDRTFTNETPTPGYATVNVTASYVIATDHTANIFSVNAFNLNDKLYYNHNSILKEISPEIGRGVRFTYTLRFF